MEELRLVGLTDDGSQLVLEWGGEPAFTIALDDRLREIIQPAEDQPAEDQPTADQPAAEVHLEPEPEQELAPPATTSTPSASSSALSAPSTFAITPREIQARVRAGAAPEDIAADCDASVEYVMRFAGPVLREREHVADLGRRARLGSASGPAPLLTDAVEHALTRRGVDLETVAYDAARLDDGTWTVVVTWEESASAARFTAATGRATWRLDASRQQATPHDDEAGRLFGRESHDQSDDEASSDAADSVDSDVIAHFVPRLALTEGAAREDAQKKADAQKNKAEEPERKRDTLVLETQPDEEPPTSRHPAGRKGKRASVPAWDDIMFGLRPDE
jgi:hypothetical protein